MLRKCTVDRGMIPQSVAESMQVSQAVEKRAEIKEGCELEGALLISAQDQRPVWIET